MTLAQKLQFNPERFALQFVYGTLRVDGWNFGIADSGCVAFVENCTARGRVYFVSRDRGYPVAKFDEEGTIVGDLLVLDRESRSYRHIALMEEGAGYELRKISVTLPDGQEIEAEAWHFIYRPAGYLIESGNWLKESKEN